GRFAHGAGSAVAIHQRVGKFRPAAGKSGRGETADGCEIPVDHRLSGPVCGRDRAGGGGVYFSRDAVPLPQAAWQARAGVVRRQRAVRPDPSEPPDVCAAVRIRDRPDLAVRVDRQPAGPDHRARAVQRGKFHRAALADSTGACMNEFELIARLTDGLPVNPAVVTGAGDDCAVLDLGAPDHLVLLKTDAVVEGTHFTRSTPPEKIGRKALARCLSDVAAMAGTPT